MMVNIIRCSVFLLSIDSGDFSSAVQFITVLCLLFEVLSCSLLSNHICVPITLLSYLFLYSSSWLASVSLFSKFDIWSVLPNIYVIWLFTKLSCSTASWSSFCWLWTSCRHLFIIYIFFVLHHFHFLSSDHWVNLCNSGWSCVSFLPKHLHHGSPVQIWGAAWSFSK